MLDDFFQHPVGDCHRRSGATRIPMYSWCPDYGWLFISFLSFTLLPPSRYDRVYTNHHRYVEYYSSPSQSTGSHFISEITLVFLAVVLLTTGFRLMVRKRVRWGWDDLFAVLAALSMAVQAIVICVRYVKLWKLPRAFEQSMFSVSFVN